MPPLFSVVIPTFNRSDLFPYAVKSILNQSFRDFEIVLSDNCSGDDTPQIAQQFGDPRFKYVCTSSHFTIGDSWEFARKQASGGLIIMLSDDDVLVSTALEHFAAEVQDCDGDFLFSSIAEYRDNTYPGEDRNSVSCTGFSGLSRVVSTDEFVRPLFSFRQKFNMHPSAFAFPKKIADYVASRTGRFFWTNGVEYSAWPITAAFAKRIVHMDMPLTILGRTGKSWGSNIVQCNPGKEKIQAFIKDVDHVHKYVPLNNFTIINLIAEGILTAKHLFPREFASYEFDELNYLRGVMHELRRRQALGVDVSAEIDETLRYSSKYPSLDRELRETKASSRYQKDSFVQLSRSAVGKLVGRKIRQRIHSSRLAQELKRGEVGQGFKISGDNFCFSNILECSQFLQKSAITPKLEALGVKAAPARHGIDLQFSQQ